MGLLYRQLLGGHLHKQQQDMGLELQRNSEVTFKTLFELSWRMDSIPPASTGETIAFIGEGERSYVAVVDMATGTTSWRHEFSVNVGERISSRRWSGIQ